MRIDPIRATVAVAALGLPLMLNAAEEAPPLPEQAKAIVQEFAGALMGELEAALEQGGPVVAIDICRDRAPAIAEELSERTGWQVGRASLKVRNMERGTPDDWERTALEQFDARRAAGEDAQAIAHAETVVDGEGAETFRFMKAVPVAPLCLACHGDAVTEEVAARLDEHYPNDQARGYQLGQLRGAFSLAKPL